MDLVDEIQAIDKVSAPANTTQSDNVFLYGFIGILVLLGIWLIYTFVSEPSQLGKVVLPLIQHPYCHF